MSFKNDLLDYIEEYTDFEIVVPGPAGGHISYDGLEVPYKLGAKNTPQEIKETVANDPDNNNEYSCATKSQFRRCGNHESGTGNHLNYDYASLLA
jgi:hypothetical protein